MRHQMTVQRLVEGVRLPSKAHDTDLGWDFYLPRQPTGPICLVPQVPKVIALGVCLALPAGLGMILKDRSSMALRGIHCLGGVIDPEYRGEIKAVLVNTGRQDMWIAEGDKVIQGVLTYLIEADLTEGPVSLTTMRGDKGFGASDKKGKQ